MSEKKKTDKSMKSWLDNHDLDELIDTTNKEIKPKYEMIPKGNTEIIRKVIISTLPKDFISEKKGLELTAMVIIDNGIEYSLPFDSIALQRSLISLAIKECEAKTKKDIDLSKLLGKMYGIKREQFTVNKNNKTFTQAPLKFFRLSEN